MRYLIVCLTVCLSCSWAPSVPAQWTDSDVPYVPTPDDIVKEMLTMADVDGDDLLYDLGCGDGRIVIAAVRDYGARGIGVDKDPERIAESRANAKEAGVEDRVVFTEGDLFEFDFSDATVVTMYLLPQVNIMLRPRILNELRPGTRIVSHDFDMDEWKPDKIKDMRAHVVLFWVVPGNMTGTWRWDSPDGRGDAELAVDQEYQRFTGTVTAGDRIMPVTDGDIDGATVSFTCRDGGNGLYVYNGTVNGDRITGTITLPGSSKTVEWTARRDDGTFRRLTLAR